MVEMVGAECTVAVSDSFNRCICKMSDVPKIRGYNAGFSQRRPEFISNIIYTEFLGYGVTLQQVCLQVLHCPIVPQLLYICLSSGVSKMGQYGAAGLRIK